MYKSIDSDNNRDRPVTFSIFEGHKRAVDSINLDQV